MGIFRAVSWMLGADNIEARLTPAEVVRAGVAENLQHTRLTSSCLKHNPFLLPATFKAGIVGHELGEQRLVSAITIPPATCFLQYAGVLAPATSNVACIPQLPCEQITIQTSTMPLSAWCCSTPVYAADYIAGRLPRPGLVWSTPARWSLPSHPHHVACNTLASSCRRQSTSNDVQKSCMQRLL